MWALMGKIDRDKWIIRVLDIAVLMSRPLGLIDYKFFPSPAIASTLAAAKEKKTDAEAKMGKELVSSAR